MKRLVSATAILLIASVALPITATGAERRKGKWHKLRKVSEFILLGAHAADAHSSWRRMEANPLLANAQGRFGIKGLAIKGAIVGGVLGMQHMFNRQGKHDKAFAITNFAMAGAIGMVTLRNHRLPSRLRRR